MERGQKICIKKYFFLRASERASSQASLTIKIKIKTPENREKIGKPTPFVSKVAFFVTFFCAKFFIDTSIDRLFNALSDGILKIFYFIPKNIQTGKFVPTDEGRKTHFQFFNRFPPLNFLFQFLTSL